MFLVRNRLEIKSDLYIFSIIWSKQVLIFSTRWTQQFVLTMLYQVAGVTPSEVIFHSHFSTFSERINLLPECAWGKAVKIQFMERQGCSHSLNGEKRKGEQEIRIRYLLGYTYQGFKGGCMGTHWNKVNFKLVTDLWSSPITRDSSLCCSIFHCETIELHTYVNKDKFHKLYKYAPSLHDMYVSVAAMNPVICVLSTSPWIRSKATLV